MKLIQTHLEFDEPKFVQDDQNEVQKSLLKKKSKGGRRNLNDDSKIETAIPPDEILFQKRYYSIGKVADMLGEKVSMIRYWDNEFTVLKPKKNAKGDRHFRPEDVKTLQLIHDLVRNRKYTIPGAKEFLKNPEDAMEQFDMIQSLEKIKIFLIQIKNNL